MADTGAPTLPPLTVRRAPLDRKVKAPAPAPAGPSRGDGNPKSNARGQNRAFVPTLGYLEAQAAAAEAAEAAAAALLADEIAAETAAAPEEAVTGPFGWAAAGFAGVGIAGTAALLAYRRHLTAEAKKKVAEAKKKLKDEEDEAKKGGGPDKNVAVEGDKPREFLVGPYGEIDKKCKASSGETHHIIPDRVYRLGNRPPDSQYDSTDNRVPGTPTFNQGQSVCLSKLEHRTGQDAVHKSLDTPLQDFGKGKKPPGVAPIGSILQKANSAIDQIKTLSPECKKKAKAAAQLQARPIRDKPGRTSMTPP